MSSYAKKQGNSLNNNSLFSSKKQLTKKPESNNSQSGGRNALNTKKNPFFLLKNIKNTQNHDMVLCRECGEYNTRQRNNPTASFLVSAVSNSRSFLDLESQDQISLIK